MIPKNTFVINSVQDLLRVIKKFRDHGNIKNKKYSIFYRGDRMFHNEVKPSIYYGNKLIKHEDEMFKETILYNPEEFKDEKSTFEKLVKMQHYGLPTRILDITSNPLIALFFACSKKKEDDEKKDEEEDGEEEESSSKNNKVRTPQLVIIIVPNKRLKFYDSDTVSVVSNICRRPIDGLNIFPIHAREKTLKKRFNKFSEIGYLHHEIKQEKPYFQNLIKKEDLQSVWCVKPLLKNKRIIRQQGAFLLYGIAGNNKGCPQLKHNSERTTGNIDYAKIKINSKKTEDILEELENLGISQITLMPEIDSVSQELKKIYSK